MTANVSCNLKSGKSEVTGWLKDFPSRRLHTKHLDKTFLTYWRPLTIQKRVLSSANVSLTPQW